MAELTRRYHLVWDRVTKEIIKDGGNTTYTEQDYFEADTRAEIDAKIEAEQLKKREKDHGEAS